MTVSKTVLLALLATLSIAVAQCPSGLQSCNGGCYNPAQSSCVTDSVNGKPLICPTGNAACNGACYLPSTYHCANGGLQYGPTPVVTSSTAAAAKSTTSAAKTTSSTQAAAKSTTSSSAAKTTSSTQAPTTSSAAKSTTSSSAAKTTSSTQAPTTSSAAQPTSSTQAPTTSSAAQATSSTQAPAATTSSTQAAAATQAACVTTGCGAGYCNCNGACYSPSQYNCPLDPVTGKYVMCWGTQAACGGSCYDSTAYHCSNGAIAQGAAAANTGAAAASTSSTPVATTSTPAPVVNPTPAPVGPYPTQTADLRIINSCKTTLWFEARYGGAGAPIPGQTATATMAAPGAYIDYTVPDTGLSGSRFWAKYGCDSNGKNCVVGDQMQYWPNPPGGCPANGCTPPVDSLFEATWGCRPGSSCNSQNPTTWFDTSQVDGWTIPYKLTPVGDTSGCDCVGTQCGFTGVDASTLDLAKCPQTEYLTTSTQSTATVLGQTVSLNSVDLRIIQNNQVVGCMSPCKRLNWGTPYGLQQPESSGSTMWMCCPTPTPDNCSPSNGCVSPTTCRAGPISTTQYVQAVHTMAPGVYSFSYDDGVGLHACPAGVTKYTMEFCPTGSAQYPLPL